MREWTVVYQSRSGRPGDPWLEPDICDYLRRERAAGLEAAVICPIGFVCDHIEVLYDLDREAASVAREIGLPMARADAVNDDPLFLDMMADMVLRTVTRYEHGRPLPLAAPGFSALSLWSSRLIALDVAILLPPAISRRAIELSAALRENESVGLRLGGDVCRTSRSRSSSSRPTISTPFSSSVGAALAGFDGIAPRCHRRRQGWKLCLDGDRGNAGH